MKKLIVLAITLSLTTSVFALGLDGKKAAYQGGTEKEKYFPGTSKPVEGMLNLKDDKEIKFEFNKTQTYAIPYDKIVDIEYGQKAGRRVGAAVATALLISPIGLFMLFSKKRKHFVTIGYKGAEGKDEVAVFELGKDIVRTTLPILEARSGKKLTYQDEEAKKSGKGS